MGKLFSALKVILVQLLVLSIISGIIGCGSGGLPPSDAPTTGTTPGTPTQPPTPGDFTASAAKTTQVNMSWTASTGAASYNIYRDGTLLKNVPTTSATDAGLTANTKYCYTLSALLATNSESAQTAQACVTMPAIEAPTNLATVSTSQSQINLSWTAPVGGAAGYNIYKKIGGGGSITLLKSVTTTSTSDTGLTANTQYCYMAAAYDVSGKESVQTAPVCLTTSLTAPGTPTGLTPTATSPTQINLTWIASAGTPAAVGYKIFKDGVYLRSVTTTSANDTGLTANTRYCYTVSAYDSGGNDSAQGASLCATTYGPPPTDPGNLTTFIETPAKVILSWSASVGATEYYIYRNGVKITTAAPVTGTTYTDTAATANAQNIYRVTAINAAGSESSGLANQITVNTALTVPTVTSATANTSSQITIVWTNAGAGTQVAGYKIYRSGSLVQTIPSAATLTYADSTGLTASTQYCYRVSAIDASGKESAQSSASLCATTYGPPPTDPGNLTTFIETPAKVILSWSASVGATEYYIYRNGVKITTAAPVTGTTYTDTAATANAQNIYRVTAINAAGSESSGLANQITVNTALTVPTMTSATANTSSQITIVWTNAGAGTQVAGYKIYRSGSLVQTIPSAATLTYADSTGLTASTQYCYRVSAIDASGKESAQSSASLCATTYGPPPTDPGNLTTLIETPAKVILSWSASVGATEYYIYRNGVKITTAAPVTGTTYTDTAATANAQNIYRVTAINAAGSESSGLANQITVNTALTVPTMTSATANTSSQITIVWTNAGAGTQVAGYKIYRSGSLVQTIPSAATLTYADSTGLTASTQYCYRVSAIDASGKESAQSSASLCATTYGPPPTDPGNLTTFIETPAKVILSWSASVGATEYYIYRNGVKITTAAPVTGTTYTDTAATANAQNIYRVTAINAAGSESSGLANQITVNTALTVPTMTSATANTSSQITIVWTNAGAGTQVAGYKIYRSGSLVQTIPSAATLTYADSTGLTASTQYCYRVSAIDASGKESAQSSASLCATTYGPPPTDPGNLTTFIETPAKVILSWSASVGATEYYIYRNGVKITTAAPVTGTTYTDTAATANAQNIYRVTAINAAGSESSGLANQITVNTALTVPTVTSATANTSSQITIVWTNAGAGTQVAGYKIYRSGSLVQTIPSAATLTYADSTGLTASTQYCYRVSAIDASGKESAQSSASLCATTYGPPPTDPGNLTTFIETPAKVILSWSASVGATEYYIYRNGVKITTAAPVTGTTYTDTAATANAQNIYRVTAINAAGSESSGLANQITVNTALTVPTMTSATANTSSQITIVWTNAGAGTQVAGYKIYRSGSLVQTIPSAATLTYADSTGLTASTQYCYRVSAIDASGKESAQSSASLCATTYGPPPVVPVGVTASAVSTTQVNLSWTASPGALQYKIYRNGSLLGTSTTAYYLDTTAVANTPYTYTVRAIDATGSESTLSTPSNAHTGLTVPTTVVPTANSSSQITVSWTNSGGANVAGYKVYQNGTQLGTTLPLATTSVVSGGLTASTQYCYTVSATDAVGNESARSGMACTNTFAVAPSAPTGLTTSAISDTKVNLSWTASTGAVKYYVYRDGTKINPTVPAVITGTSYSDLTVVANTSYVYTVTAVETTGGESAQSTSSSVHTGLTVPTIAVAVNSFTQTTLTLTDTGGDNVIGFKIYRNNLVGWASVPKTTTTIVDSGLVASTQYCYKVSAIDSLGNESAQSGAICAITNKAAPGSPTGLTPTAVGATQINLSWTAPATGTAAVGYKIYRDGSVTPLKSVTTILTSDTGLTADTRYCYAVSAYDIDGNESPQTSSQCATTDSDTPLTPTALNATANSSTRVDLSWTAAVGAEAYNVYRNSLSSDGIHTDWTLLGSVRSDSQNSGATLPAPSVSDLTATWSTALGPTTHMQYCYSVSAFLKAGGSESPRSAMVCVATP